MAYLRMAKYGHIGTTDEARMQSSCYGKQGFDSYQMAVKVMNKLRFGARNAYRCDFCHKWHIGRSSC